MKHYVKRQPWSWTVRSIVNWMMGRGYTPVRRARHASQRTFCGCCGNMTRRRLTSDERWSR